MKRMPWFLIGLALAPTLTLFAQNVKEVELSLLWVPLLTSGGMVLLLWGVLAAVSRQPEKAAIFTAWLGFLFFSYGHVYDLLRSVPEVGIALARHRYLSVVYGALLLGGAWLVVRRLRVSWLEQLFAALNIFSLSLLAFPTYQIVNYQFTTATFAQTKIATYDDGQVLVKPDGGVLPDIYFIVLDGYTRTDALEQDLGFDNHDFVETIQSQGFYVVPCSQSNYNYTMGSLQSVLNMNYLPELGPLRRSLGISSKDMWLLIRRSLVRSKLEALGYESVGFETGYEWTRMADADIFIGRGQDPLAFQRFTPFESMLIKSTAALILTDSQSKLMQQSVADVNYPYDDHVNIVTFILEQLPLLAKNPAPTFVFAHILVPHVPYVFLPDGSLNEDSNCYSGPKSAAINDKYERIGYLNNIQFINQRVAEILTQILADSETPPIIFIMGDHGLKNENRSKIISLYYLPDPVTKPLSSNSQVYATITPVNAFRLIFNRYFGADYPFVADVSYAADASIVPETSSECLAGQR